MLVLVLDLAVEGYFLALNWSDPPVTAYMLEEQAKTGSDYVYDTVDVRYVSRWMIAATLAHEDATLPTRFTGLDWVKLMDRAQAYEAGEDDPSGSPIPEQLSKNLLLYSGRNAVRKALDALLAEQLVHAMPKTRVLELYLNVAQFGPGLYGVCDASWYYFGVAPDSMSQDEAIQLMGLLPGPDNAHRAPGGGIDTSGATGPTWYTKKKIAGARQHVPDELQRNGGDVGLAVDVGFTDNASLRPDEPRSCRTMPDGVQQRIKDGR